MLKLSVFILKSVLYRRLSQIWHSAVCYRVQSSWSVEKDQFLVRESSIHGASGVLAQHFFLLDVCIGSYTAGIVFLPLEKLNFSLRGKPIALAGSGVFKNWLLLINLSTKSSQQADKGEGVTVCFQDDVMTSNPYFKDEFSGLCQHSNTVESTTCAKRSCDLTAGQSQPTDALAAHTVPLGQGVWVLILRFLLETFACQCYVCCSIGFQVMSICVSIVTILLVNHQQAEVALILITFLSPFLEGENSPRPECWYTQQDRLLCSWHSIWF